VHHQEFPFSPPIGEDIVHLAREHQPGRPQVADRVTHPRCTRRRLHVSLSMLPATFSIASPLLTVLFLQVLHSPWLFTSSWSILFCIPTFFILQAMLSPQCLLSICEERQLLQQASRHGTVKRQRERATIRQTPTDNPVDVPLLVVPLTWTICSYDGSTRTWMDRKKYLKGLHEPQLTRLRLPLLLADDQNWRILSCGSMTLDHKGMTISGQHLPQASISKWAQRQGRPLVISHTQPHRQFSVSTRCVPPICLLLALYYQRCGHSEQESNLVHTPGQPGQRIDPLPAELTALAGTLLLPVAALACTHKGICALPVSDPLASPCEFACMCMLSAAGGIGGIIGRLQQLHSRTYTVAHSLLFQRALRAPVVYRWQERKASWSLPSFLYRPTGQAELPGLCGHRLQVRSGENCMLTRFTLNQQVPGESVKGQIVPVQLPAVVSAYHQAEAIVWSGADQPAGDWRGQAPAVLASGHISVAAKRSSGHRRRKPWDNLREPHVPNLFLRPG